MNDDIKNYIDQKYAEHAATKKTEQAQAAAYHASQKRVVLKIVLYCSVIMIFLLGIMLWILYTYQLRGFLHSGRL